MEEKRKELCGARWIRVVMCDSRLATMTNERFAVAASAEDFTEALQGSTPKGLSP